MNHNRSLFLDSCEDIAAALRDPRLGEFWDEPSVLDAQTVGSVAAHVSHSCRVALMFLAQPIPDGPADFDSAADYYVKLLAVATDEMHEGIRQRGAEDAAVGPAGTYEQFVEELAELSGRLQAEPHDRLIGVYGGNAMSLDDYLGTRIIEHVVHLDDLSRSIDGESFRVSPAAEQFVIACGVEIGRRRFGGTVVVRALFREPDGDGLVPFPVL